MQLAEKRDKVLIKRILVAVDDSPSSAAASRYATEMARKLHAELIFLHVIHRPGVRLAPADSRIWLDEYYSNYERKASKMIDRLASSAMRRKVKVKKEIRAATSSVVEEIVSSASSKGAGIVVVGFRGHGGLKRLILGSVSHGVLKRAHCPVMVVK
jgi:nucleotide-binding universal stress UspA family protein